MLLCQSCQSHQDFYKNAFKYRIFVKMLLNTKKEYCIKSSLHLL